MITSNIKIFLFNPISRVHIELPPISTIPCFNKSLEVPPHPSSKFTFTIKKIVLSSECASTFTVAALCGAELAICQPNDKKWTIFRQGNNTVFLCTDVLFSSDGGILNVLYDTRDDDKDVPFDIKDVEVNPDFNMKLRSKGISIRIVPDLTRGDEVKYCALWSAHLVNKELLYVRKEYNMLATEDDISKYYFQTRRFEVFKSKHNGRDSYTLELMGSLGDHAMFLQPNGDCFSISGKIMSGFNKNCIYFLDGIMTTMKRITIQIFPSNLEYSILGMGGSREYFPLPNSPHNIAGSHLFLI
ncbi:hypothetical protein Tsubulata_035762 [Turnera subulata]|uniref:KIB1-4 beta-propeller domain-containing protein n=1 Tax=Turnera subulata TaxID=218843 RepID=A0A9Q0FEV7_9ROSI|nr:hypothetical protein Tsubulata_035762 [Turnera subulata]